jgi:hypothetical protein
MSLTDTLRKLFGRAKDQASDLAQFAKTKIEIRDLEGRRDHVLRDIGRRVYAMHKEGRAPSEFETLCADVKSVEEKIAQKKSELETLRDREPAPAAQPR